MGHDIQSCHVLKLMREITSNAYRVQGVEPKAVEVHKFQQGNFPLLRNNLVGQQYPPMHGGGFGNRNKGAYWRGSIKPLIFYNYGEKGNV